MKIGWLRWLIQISSLLIIIYGGYILSTQLTSQSLEINGTPIVNNFPHTSLLSSHVLDKQSISNLYAPVLSCRFNPQGGFFRGCSLHFLQLTFTWLPPLTKVLQNLLIIIIALFILGRFWCGWICPLGTIGDILTWLKKTIKIPITLKIPATKINLLNYFSQITLILTLGISLLMHKAFYPRFQCFWFLPYCRICPARLICPEFGKEFDSCWTDFSHPINTIFTITAWAILAFFIFSFLFLERLWCRFCPVGLINSWFNKIAPWGINKEAKKCNSCGACANKCPMSVSSVLETKTDSVIKDNNCIYCLNCIEACPRDNCLSLNFSKFRLYRSKYKKDQR